MLTCKTARMMRIALALSACGAAVPTVASAESPLDFLFGEHRRREQVQRVEPPAQAAPAQSGGLFQRLFEPRPQPRRTLRRAQPRQAQPVPVETAQANQDFERVVCRRVCDGKELSLGIVPKSRDRKELEAMCTAAGHGLQTALAVDDFVPGAGFTPILTADAAPLRDGRSALSADPAVDTAPAAAGTCSSDTSVKPFMVPLLNDATLRHGDIVATAEGFKTFVGRGRPPFDESDFVDQDDRRLPKEVRSLQIAASQ